MNRLKWLIDDDWSALCIRKIVFIKNLTRNHNLALSEEQKKRTKN